MDIYKELAWECCSRLRSEDEKVTVLSENVSLRRFRVEGKEARGLFGRGEGDYLSLEFKDNLLMPYLQKEAVRVTANAFEKLIRQNRIRTKTVLVAGLGNSKMRADSLGTETASLLNERFHGERIKTVIPSVFGETGVESSDVVQGVVAAIKPDLLVAVDTLACRSPENMFNTIQITDAGISPGAGVGNRRKSLDKTTLGVPVIAVGMPLVSYTTDHPRYGEMVVTPREIDVMVKRGASIIARALTKTMS